MSMRIMFQRAVVNVRELMLLSLLRKTTSPSSGRKPLVCALHRRGAGKNKAIKVCRQCLGATLTDKQAGKGMEKSKDLAVKFLTASLKRYNVEKMSFMNKRLVTGKGVSKNCKKGLKMLKDAAEECRNKKAKEFNERHCYEDTQLSAYSAGEPAYVA